MFTPVGATASFESVVLFSLFYHVGEGAGFFPAWPQKRVVARKFFGDPKVKFETKTFELKNSTVRLWLLITALLTVMGIFLFMNVQPDSVELTLVLASPLTLAFPLNLAFLLTSKVRFDNDRVVQFSIFGTKELMLNNIKSFGVFAQSRFSCWLVDSETAIENSLFDTNFIFLSESSTFDLGNWKQERNIRILFRKDIYKKIKDWLTKE